MADTVNSDDPSDYDDDDNDDGGGEEREPEKEEKMADVDQALPGLPIRAHILRETLMTHFSNPNTKVAADALELSSALIRLFVLEATHRASAAADQAGASETQPEYAATTHHPPPPATTRHRPSAPCGPHPVPPANLRRFGDAA